MGNFIFGALVGLVIGWNFLKQPVWAKELVDKLIAWIKSLFNKDAKG